MYNRRNVVEIVSTHIVREGGGFRVRRPYRMGRVLSPFLLIDEMGPVDYGPGEALGAPWHPHRGFETVTYLLDGRKRHEDSAGNHGDLTPGDVQWMTAGRGIIHSEEPHEDFQKTGGLMHGFQIWVNLPAKDKMMEPRYQEIPSSQSPTIEKNGVWARVVAGQCMGVDSQIDTVIPITYIHLKMSPGSSLIQPINLGLNCMLYLFNGSVEISGKGVKDGNLALLDDGSEINLVSQEGCELLILAGPEINEPIARYGPFVMNTRDEIIQAIDDYNNGTLA